MLKHSYLETTIGGMFSSGTRSSVGTFTLRPRIKKITAFNLKSSANARVNSRAPSCVLINHQSIDNARRPRSKFLDHRVYS